MTRVGLKTFLMSRPKLQLVQGDLKIPHSLQQAELILYSAVYGRNPSLHLEKNNQ
jgi:hypothetical protein